MMMIWVVLLTTINVICGANVKGYHGVVAVSDSNDEPLKKYCTTFDPLWTKASEYYPNFEKAPSYPIKVISRAFNGCGNIPKYLNGSAVIIVDRGACTVEERASNLNDVGVKLIIIARTDGILNVTNVKESNFSDAPIILINAGSYDSIANFGASEDISLSFYYPVTHFDNNVLLIYAICIFCIVAGSYWSLYPKNMRVSEFWTTSPKPPLRLNIHSSEENDPDDESKGTIMTNILVGSVIVGLMTGMLLLLYFAYKYFVFVFIALFCIISATGMHDVLSLFFEEIPCYSKTFNLSMFGYEKHVAPFKAAVWLACLAIAIVWFLFRHVYGIWPLQVVMGICICLHIIRSVGPPNFKIIAIIMCMLFIYDIFFVFITPFFTKDGVSIMERVATGSSGKPVFDSPQDYTPTEQIPLSIKVPYFQDTDLKVCSPSYGMIGFGDIVIPGLLVAYAVYFDTLTHPGKFKWYYFVSVVSYAVGLILTYIALSAMESAQPALLYLVPCCVLGVLSTAAIRREVKALWTGKTGLAAPQPFGNE